MVRRTSQLDGRGHDGWGKRVAMNMGCSHYSGRRWRYDGRRMRSRAMLRRIKLLSARGGGAAGDVLGWQLGGVAVGGRLYLEKACCSSYEQRRSAVTTPGGFGDVRIDGDVEGFFLMLLSRGRGTISLERDGAMTNALSQLCEQNGIDLVDVLVGVPGVDEVVGAQRPIRSSRYELRRFRLDELA